MANVLVTGASRGIGRAIAVALAGRGDRVAVHYGSDRVAAEQTLGMLTGAGHAVVGGDLGRPDGAEGIVAAATEALGGIDILVNNAAIAPSEHSHHPIDTVSYDDWRRIWKQMIDVDLVAAANLTFLVARQVIARETTGTIVNIGSRGAFRGEPEFPAYGAAKAALHAFGQSMAVALAPHDIAVATVAPGFVSSERQAAKLAGPSGDAVRSESPFGRVGTPEEVAHAVAYLTSPGAVWASGAILDLNGASHLRT